MTIFMAFLAVVAPVAITIYFDKPSYGSMTLVSIVVAMIILKFHTIKNLSILGVLKAELEQKIREANATLEQLRGIALSTSKIALREMSMAHFPIAGRRFSQSHALRDELIRSLESIGVSEDEVEQVQVDWKSGVGFIVVNHIKHALYPSKFAESTRNTEPTKNDEAASQALGTLGDFRAGIAPKPSEIKALLREHEISQEASTLVSQILTKYEDFLITGVWDEPSMFDLKK